MAKTYPHANRSRQKYFTTSTKSVTYNSRSTKKVLQLLNRQYVNKGIFSQDGIVKLLKHKVEDAVKRTLDTFIKPFACFV